MIFSISLFVISWACFLIFADKKKFYLFAPTSLLSMYLACTTDLFVQHYPLWDYPAPTQMRNFYKHILHDIGIYPIITYFFLQTLPTKRNILTLARHILYWSILGIGIEWLAVKLGDMKHQLWWNFGWSYMCDWILFVTFYVHHRWREKHAGEKQ